MTGRKGPTFLGLPGDIILSECSEKLASMRLIHKKTVFAHPYGDPKLIKKTVELLLNARKPLIIAGSGLFWSEAWRELVTFGEILNIPIISEGLGRGCVPENHPLSLGAFEKWPISSITRNIISQSDTLLTIGIMFEPSIVDIFSRETKIIQVDIEPSEIGRNKAVNIGIIGDARVVLTQLIEISKKILKKTRIEDTTFLNLMKKAIHESNEGLVEQGLFSGKPIKPQRLAREIRDFLPSDVYVVLDGSEFTFWCMQYLKSYFPAQLITTSRGLGTLGQGIPFGIGVKLAKPEKKVLVIAGDGSFLMSAKELDTAARHNIKIVSIIGNDCAWGLIRHQQEIVYQRVAASVLSEKVRYDKFAESLGCYGELVIEPEEIKPALKRAFDSEVPAVIDVRIDPNEQHPIVKQLENT